MTSLLWPGDHRAGDHLSDAAVLAAMLEVEDAWLDGLIAARIAPPEAACDLTSLVGPADLATLAEDAEDGGNPVIATVTLLRERAATDSPAAARWLHRGLTSQDVLDTALMLELRGLISTVSHQLRDQVASLARTVDDHRGSLMAGRTLTQYAVPTTFGRKAASWLDGLLAAARDLDAVAAQIPGQLGGAGGTMAATTELARRRGLVDPSQVAWRLAETVADRLGLAPAVPWHTNRAPITRVGDALVRACDAWGHIAADVLVLARPEIAEVREAAKGGRGGSSTMPQKANPVLAVLLRRTAMAAPGLGAQLHLAAAEQVDERATGAWHLEWPALQRLGRAVVAAADQATELLQGLDVEAPTMRRRALANAEELLAERRSLTQLVADDAATQTTHEEELGGYLGTADRIITTVLSKAEDYLQEKR